MKKNNALFAIRQPEGEKMEYDFVAITSGQTDADSPINQQLIDALREDIYHLKEWAYGLDASFTPSPKHDHDDINSKSVVLGDGVVTEPKLAEDACTPSKIKKASGTVSTGNIPAGGYAETSVSQYALAVSFYAPSDLPVYRVPSSTTPNYHEILRFHNTTGGGVTVNIHATVLTSSKRHIIVYYDPLTGNLEACWESGQNDFPILAIDGKTEIEPIKKWDAQGKLIPMDRIDLPETHRLVLTRDVELEKAAKKNKFFAQAIIEQYKIDLNTKELIPKLIL